MRAISIPIMKAQGHGRIINVGSISAKVPRKHSPAYTASKWGLDGPTRALAVDCREDNIAVSVLHPGIVATELRWRAEYQAGGDDRACGGCAGIIVHMAICRIT